MSETTDIRNAPAVRRANKAMKSIGLGAMNLHGYLAQNGIAYESPEARDFANTFFMMVNFYSIQRSAELAKEKAKRLSIMKAPLMQRENISINTSRKSSRRHTKKSLRSLKACTFRQSKTGKS